MAENGSFLTDILGKIARKYERTGKLGGTMKLGTGLLHDQLHKLHQFFGVDPIRISRNEEVRLHLDHLLRIIPTCHATLLGNSEITMRLRITAHCSSASKPLVVPLFQKHLANRCLIASLPVWQDHASRENDEN